MSDKPDKPEYEFPFLMGYPESSLTPAEKALRGGKQFLQNNPFTTAGIIRLGGSYESALSGIYSGSKYRMVAGVISMGAELSMFLLGDKLLFKMIDKAKNLAGMPVDVAPQAAAVTAANASMSSDTLVDRIGVFLKQSTQIKSNPKDFVLLLGLIGSGLYMSSGISGFIDSGMAPEKGAEVVKGVLLASGFSAGRFMKKRKTQSVIEAAEDALPPGALQRYMDSVHENPAKLMGDLLLAATMFTLLNAGVMLGHGQGGWEHELYSGLAFGGANSIIRCFGRINRSQEASGPKR